MKGARKATKAVSFITDKDISCPLSGCVRADDTCLGVIPAHGRGMFFTEAPKVVFCEPCAHGIERDRSTSHIPDYQQSIVHADDLFYKAQPCAVCGRPSREPYNQFCGIDHFLEFTFPAEEVAR